MYFLHRAYSNSFGNISWHHFPIANDPKHPREYYSLKKSSLCLLLTFEKKSLSKRTTENWITMQMSPHISIRMAKMKITDNTKWWWKCGVKGTLIYCWWDFKVVQRIWQFHTKLIMLLLYDPVLTLDIQKDWKLILTQKPTHRYL